MFKFTPMGFRTNSGTTIHRWGGPKNRWQGTVGLYTYGAVIIKYSQSDRFYGIIPTSRRRPCFLSKSVEKRNAERARESCRDANRPKNRRVDRKFQQATTRHQSSCRNAECPCGLRLD